MGPSTRVQYSRRSRRWSGVKRSAAAWRAGDGQKGIVVLAEGHALSVRLLCDEVVAIQVVGGLKGEEGSHAQDHRTEDFVPVRLERRDGALWADPVFGKSNLIYTLVHADGMLRVPLDKAGLYAGDEIAVSLFR